MVGEIYNSAREDIATPLIDHLLDKGPVSEVLEHIPGILLDSERIKMVEAEDYILQWGGMPALLHMADDERWQWLKDYEYTYLERDMADLASLSDLAPFRTFSTAIGSQVRKTA
jgi:predicted AAA+ superfamily ATPase